MRPDQRFLRLLDTEGAESKPMTGGSALLS
jgi:hypothetical protein